MKISEWISLAGAPAVAIAVGGTEQLLLEEIVQSPSRRFRVLCDRDLSSDLAMLATDRAGRQPSVQLVRRLDRDIEAIIEGGDEVPVVIPFRMVGIFLLQETERLSRTIELIAGYRMEDVLIAHALVAGLRRLIAQAAFRGRSPFLFHDSEGGYLTDARCHARIIPMTSDEVDPSHLALLDVLASDEAQVDLLAPNAHETAHHIDFILEAEPAELRKLHDLATMPATQRRLEAVWRRNIQRLSKDNTEGHHAAAALVKLQHVFAAEASTPSVLFANHTTA
ncbi:MAG: hypothetical protein AAF882_05135 [Pseudomonadota bacterium]